MDLNKECKERGGLVPSFFTLNLSMGCSAKHRQEKVAERALIGVMKRKFFIFVAYILCKGK